MIIHGDGSYNLPYPSSAVPVGSIELSENEIADIEYQQILKDDKQSQEEQYNG